MGYINWDQVKYIRNITETKQKATVILLDTMYSIKNSKPKQMSNSIEHDNDR